VQNQEKNTIQILHMPPPKIEEKLTPQEIVKRSMERMDPSADWENVYSHVYAAIKSNKFRALRHGETILFFQVQSPVASQAHLFSADPQEKFLEALREFGKALKISGYKKLNRYCKKCVFIAIN
jgi:hypothetical protein